MKQINLKQVNWMKALKIAGGGVAAILLAEALGLQNAASAGIITLLTVQNTRRETVMSSVRRFAGFGIMTLLSLPIYHFCGTAPWSFGIVLLLLLLLCYAFRMDDATPINAVMATHYMFAGGVSIGMVGNEILLLVIGSGIGVCLNWFMPRNLKKIHEMQRQLDLWNDPDYISTQARERLGYVRPGETQYTVVDPGPQYQDSAMAAAAAPTGPARPWVQQLAILVGKADQPPNATPIPSADTSQSGQAPTTGQESGE